VGTRVRPRGWRSLRETLVEKRQVSWSLDRYFPYLLASFAPWFHHDSCFCAVSTDPHGDGPKPVRHSCTTAAATAENCHARERLRDGLVTVTTTTTTMGLEISFADLHDTTTFFSGNYDVSSVFVTIGCALSIYNGLELLLLVFTTFRRFQGLYFWSLLIASFGLLPYTLGLLIMYFTFINSRKSCLVSFRIQLRKHS